MNITQMEDIKKTAKFLYELNQQSEHHVGYIRVTLQSIEEQLALISKEDMLLVMDEDDIIAAFGIERINDAEANVLGPITKQTDEMTLNMIKVMWQDFLISHPGITTYYFSLHEDHRFGQSVMKNLRTQYLGTTYTMKTTENKTTIVPQVIKYKPVYKRSFTDIMKDLYVDFKPMRDKILNTIGNTHELYLYLNEGIVKGFIWIQINDDDSCDIQFVYTHLQYRQKGIGHDLVSFAVDHAFKKHHATSVQLSVKSKREKDIDFYEKLGFKKINEMNHFKYTVE
ncbi:GNAT family N-acetyltransferase [Macrococcus armenti]|uniref:GNAT family N-acetyltransferase n=1 Tax=Macrococcus armenti TaxID=2875764 RepID=UPI001CCD4B8F|nr:GNAT family N-acetyltransferase [Macrococcus armenti]UBH08781.1 GNAT family N-acetyltransferase [Macrococcus armenti]UBH11078.1 GNAT family N-acetyltransferase [Macrococcus armenti]